MVESPSIFQVNVSRGGVPKWAIPEAKVTTTGIATDRQADRRSHGGPDRALCLYALEAIVALRKEGHDVEPGSTGENITTVYLDWSRVLPGTRMWLGNDVLIEVTDYAAPCWKNARWFADGDFNRINQKAHAGGSRVYARVLREGAIRPGDAIALWEQSTAERLERMAIPVYRWPRDFR